MRQNSRAARLLLELAEATEDALLFGYQPRLVAKYGMEGAKRVLAVKEMRRRREILRRMETQKLVKLQKMSDGVFASLTEEGRMQAFRQQVLQSDLLPEGQVCMVVFDIPERHCSVRRELRRFLGRAGFIPIQWSVWISPFDAAEALERLFRVQQRDDWIRIYTAVERRAST